MTPWKGQHIGGTVRVLAVWGGTELDNFNAMIKPFEDQTGIKVQVETTRDLTAVLSTQVKGGNPPDVAGIPNPGTLVILANQGALKPLDSVLDMAAMKTQYDPKGTIDDSTAIENMVLSYEPFRMFSIRVTKAPEGFQFPNAIKKMWSIVYFTPQGEKSTRVRIVSLGFTSDDESKRMREFFNQGNAFTLKQLQRRFSEKIK